MIINFLIIIQGMFMTIKIRLTEEEEQMILSQEEADNLKVERDHIHITGHYQR